MRKFLVGLVILIISAIPENTLHAQDLPNKLNMLEIVISNLIARVDALEKRVGALEKNLSAGMPKTQKREVTGKDSAKSFLAGGLEDIGKGFFARNVHFTPFGDNVLFTGEIVNRSEKNYRFAKFKIEIYDDNGLLVKKEEFTIPDIPCDSIRSFEAMLVGIEAGLVNKYVIVAIE